MLIPTFGTIDVVHKPQYPRDPLSAVLVTRCYMTPYDLSYRMRADNSKIANPKPTLAPENLPREPDRQHQFSTTMSLCSISGGRSALYQRASCTPRLVPAVRMPVVASASAKNDRKKVDTSFILMNVCGSAAAAVLLVVNPNIHRV